MTVSTSSRAIPRQANARAIVVMGLQGGFTVLNVGLILLAPSLWQADLASFFQMHLLFAGLGALVLGFVVRGIGRNWRAP